MSGDKEQHHDHAQETWRELRHEVQNSLYAVELTATAMVSADGKHDRESLARVVADEIARIRDLLPRMTTSAPSRDAEVPRQQRRGN